MRRLVWVCVVIVSACVVWVPRLFAAAPEAIVETPEVVVSSKRLPDVAVDAKVLPTKSTIITAEDIQRTGAKTIQEAIQWATGIVMYDQVGNAFQQTIDLRGFNGQPVQGISVFVDGQRINEPDFNTVNFDLIPFETIDRIEILPGASAIFGKNALGGVINIITKRGGGKHQVTGETLFGSFHRERYSINASGPIGKFDYYTNFSRETEEGFRVDSNAAIARFYGRLGYRPTEQTDLSVSLTYVKDRLHQAGSLPLSQAAISPRRNFTPGDFVDNETSVLRFTGRHAFPLGFALNVNGFYRRLGQEQYTVGQSSVSDNLAQTESKGGIMQLTHDASLGSSKNALVIGGEMTRNDFNNSAVAAFTGFGSFPSARSSNEDIVAFYAQDTFTVIPGLALTAGARYDHDQLGFTDNLTSANNGSRRFSRTTTRVGASYAVSPWLTTYFNYGEGFRVPTFDELFAQGGFGSNPNLNAVRSRTYEIGAKLGQGASVEGSLAAFQTDVRDEIFFTCRVCDFTDGQNRNIDKTRRRGIEASVKARYGKLFDTVLNYTFTEAQFRSQVNFTAPTTRLVQVGDSLPQVPKNRLSLTANVHPADGWTLSLIGLYVSTQFHLNDEDNAQPRLPGYFQLNARVNYERPVPGGRLSGFLMLNNLLNQNYATSGIIASNTLTGGGATERFIVPVPGLAAYGGISYKFESFY